MANFAREVIVPQVVARSALAANGQQRTRACDLLRPSRRSRLEPVTSCVSSRRTGQKPAQALFANAVFRVNLGNSFDLAVALRWRTAQATVVLRVT
jgi:hypothetical protein